MSRSRKGFRRAWGSVTGAGYDLPTTLVDARERWVKVFLPVAAAWSLCVGGCEGASGEVMGDGGGPEGGDACPSKVVSGYDAATSDAGAGSATVEGTVGGESWSARGAIALFPSAPGPEVPSQIVVVIPLTFDLQCSALQATSENIVFSNQKELEIILKTGGPPLGPGTYRASGTDMMTVGANLLSVDGCCHGSAEAATDGSATITAANTTTVTGTFNLSFADGDHVDGQFAAGTCNAEQIVYDWRPCLLSPLSRSTEYCRRISARRLASPGRSCRRTRSESASSSATLPPLRIVARSSTAFCSTGPRCTPSAS